MIALAIAQFGSLSKVRGNQVEVTNLANDLAIRADIVDFGPSVARVNAGVALDLTLGSQRKLGGNGNIRVKYRFV